MKCVPDSVFLPRLSDDVLVSKTSEKLVVWQWLGYNRFFGPEDDGPKSMKAQMSDYTKSR